MPKNFTRTALTTFISLILFGFAVSQEASKVILDVDMGTLNDDAVAMFMLLQSDDVEVLGVTTVAGNTWVEEGVAATLRQLEVVGRDDVPVAFGSGEPLMGSRQ